MPVKKTKRTPAAKKRTRTTRPRIAARAAVSTSPVSPVDETPAIGAGPIIAAIACIVTFVGAIALIPSREIAPQTEVAAATVIPETPAALPAHAKAETRTDGKSAVKDPKKKMPGDPVADAAVEPVGALVTEGAPAVPPAEPIQSRPIENVAAVTITGCLEHDEESFWLKDTTGLDAPTSRSWKSGFLKKRPSRIELLDPNNALKLPAYVGRRISATGTLVNKEMQPRSLHPLGVSCS